MPCRWCGLRLPVTADFRDRWLRGGPVADLHPEIKLRGFFYREVRPQEDTIAWYYECVPLCQPGLDVLRRCPAAFGGQGAAAALARETAGAQAVAALAPFES